MPQTVCTGAAINAATQLLSEEGKYNILYALVFYDPKYWLYYRWQSASLLLKPVLNRVWWC